MPAQRREGFRPEVSGAQGEVRFGSAPPTYCALWGERGQRGHDVPERASHVGLVGSAGLPEGRGWTGRGERMGGSRTDRCHHRCLPVPRLSGGALAGSSGAPWAVSAQAGTHQMEWMLPIPSSTMMREPLSSAMQGSSRWWSGICKAGVGAAQHLHAWSAAWARLHARIGGCMGGGCSVATCLHNADVVELRLATEQHHRLRRRIQHLKVPAIRLDSG